MNVLTQSRERRGLLQKADVIATILAVTPILLAIISLVGECVKLADTIIKARSASLKGKQKRKKTQKK